jgi:AcrR family transcriptional regulator
MSATARSGKNTAGRNPERTRERILAAALHEFAARGFAGARVDVIARRAPANKRMLYHYFGDKSGLFRAVLRHTIARRRASVESQAPGGDQISTMPLWFRQNCEDADWVRLLAWESLQSTGKSICDEPERLRLTKLAINGLKQRQKAGKLRADVRAEYLQLAKASLSMFPLVMPHISRLIIGRDVGDKNFQRDYAKFLETISVAFRP